MSAIEPELDPIQALDLRWQAANRRQVQIINNLLNDGYQYDQVVESLVKDVADWQVRYELQKTRAEAAERELKRGPRPTIINS